MYQVIIVVHVLLGLGVIGFVLIQQGKGADAGAAFGSASSGSVFGAQGASSFLSRTTAVLAAAFFATSLGLAVLVGYQESEADLMDRPDVEDVFEDLPVVNGATSVPAEETVPVIIDDKAASIAEEASSLADAVKNEVQSTVETAEQNAETAIEKTKAAIPETP